jgi:hypothetical protein
VVEDHYIDNHYKDYLGEEEEGHDTDYLAVFGEETGHKEDYFGEEEEGHDDTVGYFAVPGDETGLQVDSLNCCIAVQLLEGRDEEDSEKKGFGGHHKQTCSVAGQGEQHKVVADKILFHYERCLPHQCCQAEPPDDCDVMADSIAVLHPSALYKAGNHSSPDNAV